MGNADSFEYDLSVDTESITFNESNKAASVTLVNEERAEDEDEDTEEEEIKEKTIGIFVVLLIAAIAVIGGGICLKRRKK